MDADEALHSLFLRKMKAITAENESTVNDLREFYARNELKLIALCKKHLKDKKYQSLRDFVAFEFNLHHPAPESKPPKMSMVGAGESVETHGNPDGIIHRVESSEETAEVQAEAHHL